MSWSRQVKPMSRNWALHPKWAATFVLQTSWIHNGSCRETWDIHRQRASHFCTQIPIYSWKLYPWPKSNTHLNQRIAPLAKVWYKWNLLIWAATSDNGCYKIPQNMSSSIGLFKRHYFPGVGHLWPHLFKVGDSYITLQNSSAMLDLSSTWCSTLWLTCWLYLLEALSRAFQSAPLLTLAAAL